MSQTEDATPEPPREGSLLIILPLWLVLAALGQLLHLAHWPLYLYGTIIPSPLSLLVAVVRMGVYTGLALGLVARRRAAWAGTILEFARTLLTFALLAFQTEWAMAGSVYPAGWAQGVLAAALPVMLGLNMALSHGWRPGDVLEGFVGLGVRMLVALCALFPLSLRHLVEPFDVAPSGTWRVLAREGLPFVLVLSAVEGLALFVTLQWLAKGP